MSEIYFSQIREDSRLETQLRARFKSQRVLCIGSGGCTAFSLLSDDVSTVVTVDANPAQCALIELKKVALENLTRQEYLAFIGETPDTNRFQTFRRLEDRLTPAPRNYWRQNQMKIQVGINKCGVTDRLYKLVGDNLRNLVLTPALAEKLFDCSTIEEQRSFYSEHMDNDRWKTAVRVLFSKATQSQFYPPMWSAGSSEAKFSDFYLAQITEAVYNRPISDNYFLSQLLMGSYMYDREDATPPYLTVGGYEEAQRNVDKLQIINKTVEKTLSSSEDFDAFYLSNILDWGGPRQHSTLTAKIRSSAAPTGAILLLRSMYGEGEMTSRMGNLVTSVSEMSEGLLEQERSMLYRDVNAGKLEAYAI